MPHPWPYPETKAESNAGSHLIGILTGTFENREEYDFQVEEEIPVMDVPGIIFHSLFHLPEVLCATPVAVHLRPAGYARLDCVAQHIFVDKAGVILRLAHHVRARAHHTHIAKQYIEKLGQLIER